MPIAFTCPYCGSQTDVSDEFIGKTGPCAKCGKSITISRAEEPSILPRLLTTIGLALLAGALIVAMAYYLHFFDLFTAGHG